MEALVTWRRNQQTVGH